MRAVKLALSHFDIPATSHVIAASDTSTVVAYINRVGGTQSWSLGKETELLFSLAVTHNISIRARFIPGQMNVIADDLSRGGRILPIEWSLYQHLFATRFNIKCVTFVSPAADHRALFTDALAMSW